MVRYPNWSVPWDLKSEKNLAVVDLEVDMVQVSKIEMPPINQCIYLESGMNLGAVKIATS